MRRLFPLIALTIATGCAREQRNPAPPRIESKAAELPEQSSTIVIPVSADLDALARGLNERTPHVLWQIDERREACVAGRKVNLGLGRVKLTPDLGCRIVGRVVRGPIRVSGSGERLVITMPISATLTARNVGGVISKTATGAADVRAVGRLGIAGDWQPSAKVDIDYSWREPPGIDIVGQRITFVSKADEKLKGVVAKLERDLPKELSKLQLRRQLDGVWRKGFTSIELSKRNPPAWMRISPRRLGFGGYRVDGRQLRLTLSAEALTETFVGPRPADPVVTALPPPTRVDGRPGLRFFIPVLADYAQLEPVVERTLRKAAARGIDVKGVGPVEAEFGKVTVYATTGGRLAVGVKAKVKPRGGSLGATSGEVWLSALPYNDPGSQFVRARDVRLATATDSSVVDLLIALFDTAEVTDAVARALQHDFAPDYRKVLGKARAAIRERREGDFLLSADVTRVTNGAIKVTGGGLFMPIQAEGTAQIAYRPR